MKSLLILMCVLTASLHSFSHDIHHTHEEGNEFLLSEILTRSTDCENIDSTIDTEHKSIMENTNITPGNRSLKVLNLIQNYCEIHKGLLIYNRSVPFKYKDSKLAERENLFEENQKYLKSFFTKDTITFKIQQRYFDTPINVTKIKDISFDIYLDGGNHIVLVFPFPLPESSLGLLPESSLE